MSKKNKATKIMAFLALFWIIIWIVGTWILIIVEWWKSSTKEQSLSAEQYKQIQDLIKSQWWTWALNNSWTTISKWTITESWVTTLTGKVEK